MHIHHNHTHKHTHTDTQFFSVLLIVLYPAQCTEGALSLIAFPSSLIILMVLLHATQWASACLHHIKIKHIL